jgi:hypothetical protein
MQRTIAANLPLPSGYSERDFNPLLSPMSELAYHIPAKTGICAGTIRDTGESVLAGSTGIKRATAAFDLKQAVMIDLRTGRLLLGAAPALYPPDWLPGNAYAGERVFAELRDNDQAMDALRKRIGTVSYSIATAMDTLCMGDELLVARLENEVNCKRVVAIFAPYSSETAASVTLQSIGDMPEARDGESRVGKIYANIMEVLPLVPGETEKLGGEKMKKEFEQFFSKDNIATTGAIFAVWAVSHALGVGFIVDVAMLSIAIYNSGKQALEAFEKIGQFFSIVSQKTVSEQDKAAASKLLAAAMVVLGLAAIKLIFKKVTSRKVGANSGSGDSGGGAQGGSFATRKTTPTPAPTPKPAAPSSFKGKLRGKDVELPGVTTKSVTYTRRPRTELTKLRNEFNSTERKAFAKGIATDTDKIMALKKAGLSDVDIAKLAKGEIPAGFQVHHKLPLDDGGNNASSNLILIKNDPHHLVITNAQNALTKGMAVGDSKVVDWPIPSGFVYPP